MKTLHTWTLIIGLITGPLLLGQDQPVAHIDPLAPNLLRFLDSDLEEFQWRAGQAYGRGDYLNAARWYIALVQHRTDANQALYNLACCYGKLNKPELASQTLWRAICSGFDNFKLAQSDDDFSAVRSHPAFKTVMERITLLERQFGETLYLSSQKAIRCRLHLPEKFDSKKAYPLVLALHGHGSRAENMATVFTLLKKPNFIFVAPQGAYDAARQNLSNIEQRSWTMATRDTVLWAQNDAATIASIVSMVDQVKMRYVVSSVFILGFSQGAAMAYGVGMCHPDKIDGLICFGGRLPETGHSYSFFSDEQFEAAKALPIFIAHGRKDQAIAFDAGVASKKRLQERGFDVTFYAFDGGHGIEADAIRKAHKWISRIANQEK